MVLQRLAAAGIDPKTVHTFQADLYLIAFPICGCDLHVSCCTLGIGVFPSLFLKMLFSLLSKQFLGSPVTGWSYLILNILLSTLVLDTFGDILDQWHSLYCVETFNLMELEQ